MSAPGRDAAVPALLRVRHVTACRYDRPVRFGEHRVLFRPRQAEGTQRAAETLRRRSGTCRDYAWPMIEALRSIGVACRFVTGYLYDPTLDASAPGGEGRVGAGATHAWLQVYLPGAGRVPCDPTNRLGGGTDPIRVGYAWRPQDAVPLAGGWFGDPQAHLGMTVEVSVERL